MNRIVPSKWRTIVVLTLMVLATLKWYWIWGVLMLAWVVSELLRGKFYIGEELDRNTDPLLYWLAVVIVSAIGIYWLSFVLS